MLAAGLVVTLLGFVIAVAGLGVAGGTSGRMAFALAGIVVSLVGIMGLVNGHYLNVAPWKK